MSVIELRTRRPTGRPSWPLILLAGESKTGKAQPLHARLATPTGWTTMGEVVLGGQLIGSDGGPITVTGVHDRGDLPIYRLTFSDGSTTEACGEHLWATWKAEERHRQWERGERAGQPRRLPAKVRTTEEIRQLLINLKTRTRHRSVYIPVSAPVRYAPQDRPLPVDPYVLGLLLGDGGLSKDNYPSFTSIDAELFAALEDRLPYGDYLKRVHGKPTAGIGGNHLVAALREIGVMGLKSEAKHIPERYLTATVGERLALLQGLMDTDGTLTRQTVSSGGASMFTTSSPALARDVRQLVESLGGTAATRVKTTTHLPAHELNIRLRKGMCPFRLSRKVRAFDETRPTTHCPPLRRVVQIDYIGTMPARCITVDAEDHLYLTDNFIVTHNSWAAAEFTGEERVGRAFWLDLGEGCADEYGAVPGADYDIIEHDGTWVDIIAQVEAVREVARAELAAGNKPVVFVVDSMTAEWAMLTEWTQTRAKSSKRNRATLAADPDAEIDVSMNFWNDANSRHNRLMNILKTFPGIVVMTSLETEKTQLGPGGRPLENAPKIAKPDCQKRVTSDATAWVRLSLAEPAVIVGLRSVHKTIQPGKDRPQPWADFSLAALVFDKLGIESDSAQVRDTPILDASQVLPEEQAEPDNTFTDPDTKQGRARAATGVAEMVAASNPARANKLWSFATNDPAGRVDVLGLLSGEQRAELKLSPAEKGLTLSKLGERVAGYVTANSYSVNEGVKVSTAELAAAS